MLLVSVITIVLVVLDQIFKLLVIKNIDLYSNVDIIHNFFYLTNIRNDGGAFNILSGSRIFFIILAIITIIMIIKFVLLDSNVSKFDSISYSLVLSGIIGNLIDRIFRSEVVDYIGFTLFNRDMPVFNFADMCIVIGAILIIFILLVKGDSDENIYSRRRSK